MILSTQVKVAEGFHDTFTTIPRTGDSVLPVEEAPVHVMERIEDVRVSLGELRDDMMGEVDKVEALLIAPLNGCKVSYEGGGGCGCGTDEDGIGCFEAGEEGDTAEGEQEARL